MLINLIMGIAVGALISAPVGPVGLLGFLQMIQRHTHSAWSLAVGTCLADTLLASFAAALADAAHHALQSHPQVITTLHGLLATLLFILAIYTWVTAPKPQKPTPKKASFALGFGMTMLHPGNIAAFATAFIILQRRYGIALDSSLAIALLALGIFTGALCMWGIMFFISHRVGQKWGSDQLFMKAKRLIAVLLGVSFIAVLFA